MYDVSDGPDDDLLIFGDIEEDGIKTDGVFVNFGAEYLGYTSDGGVVVEINGQKFLYSDTSYAPGTQITYTAGPLAVCFASGTLIRTPGGEVPVEALGEGDVVVTASDAERAIRWTGARTVDCRASTKPRQCWPVRVSADAFGPGLPEQDLWLSPAHAVSVTVMDDVLIPVGSLVNGATIQQVPVDTIDYHHIELDGHDVVIANGLPAESYLDCGNREFFARADVAPEAERQDIDPADLPFCLPFVTGGETVEAVRAQLYEQARLLGWTAEDAGPDVAVEAGGERLRPEVVGGKLRVTLPAGAREAWLLSSSWVPYHHGASADRRNLGVALRHLTVTDVTGEARRIRADDPRLTFGFHAPEGEGRDALCWTTGRALLPGSLWAGMTGPVTLTLAIVDAGETRRWVAPHGAADERDAGNFSLVA